MEAVKKVLRLNDNRSAFAAKEYDEKIKRTLPYYDEFYRQVVDLVKTCRPNALKWLDVGCGTGKMAEAAFKNIEVEKFTFCDSSSEMLEIAKERFPYPNTEFILCEIQKISNVNAYDVVTAIQVNHYLQKEDRKRAVRNCYQSLKEDGIFISFENFAPFSDFGKAVYLSKWKAYQMQQGKTSLESDNHINRYNREYFPITLTEHLELFRNCGFRDVEILWISNMQAGIWGIK